MNKTISFIYPICFVFLLLCCSEEEAVKKEQDFYYTVYGDEADYYNVDNWYKLCKRYAKHDLEPCDRIYKGLGPFEDMDYICNENQTNSSSKYCRDYGFFDQKFLQNLYEIDEYCSEPSYYWDYPCWSIAVYGEPYPKDFLRIICEYRVNKTHWRCLELLE